MSKESLSSDSLVAGILICILNVRFSSAYFSSVCIIFALFLLWVMYKGRNSGKLWKLESGFWCYDIKLLTAGIAGCYGMLLLSGICLQDSGSMKTAVDWAGFTLPVYMFFFLAHRRNIDKGMMTGLSFGILANAVYGVLQLEGLAGTLKDVNRMQGFFKHPNSLGAALVWSIPFMAWYAWKAKNKWTRMFASGVTLIALISLYQTGSRGAMGGLALGVVGCVLIYCLMHRKDFRGRTLIAGVVLCVMASVITGLGLQYSSIHERGLGDRTYMWQASMHMWRDHQVLGVGIDKWSDVYYSSQYHPAEAVEQHMYFPHNMPLYFLSGAGILGGLGYVCISLFMFVAIIRQMKKNLEITWAEPMMITFLAFMAVGMVDATLTNKTVALPYFALLGYAMGSLSRKGQDNR